jgi:hypothetical protein
MSMILAIALAATSWAVKRGDVITVRKVSAKVMAGPKFIGPVAANVSRGDQLTYEDAQGDWYKVTTKDGADGWINRADVVEKKSTLSPKPGKSSSGGASPDEVELAGRGFSPEVEDKYRHNHPDLDFSHIDGIEQTAVDPGALATFQQDGKLGGAP